MTRLHTILIKLCLALWLASFSHSVAEEVSVYTGASCSAPVEAWFVDEVWSKVGEMQCLKCHKQGGDAEDTRFVLRDVTGATAAERASHLRHNRDLFARMAREKEDGQPRLLLKVVGGLDHGGKRVLAADSAAYRILEEFARRTNNPRSVPSETTVEPNQPPFFDHVARLDDRCWLRRTTLSLAARLPTTQELEQIASHGEEAMPAILDGVLREEAFYVRLAEAFNDIFLLLGIDGNADQTVLSYEHFEKTRHWYQKHDLSHIQDENERRKAGYKLADDYRRALLKEPFELIKYIVRNDRPFTEIVTSDYIMMSPYTARGYGMYDDVQAQFKNEDDPFEYVPVKLKALVGRSRPEDQDSPTGLYPHAGVLSTFQYLTRYPTTETNRNRLRARMYYQHFLGVDVLELAARVTDAAAVTAKYEIPTMQASECVVCHKTLDPVAGLFQDYWRFADAGVYGKRKGGWFIDMFPPGYEGEAMPADDRWRALAWLGERTAKDPRFAVAMVEHAYFLLTGRKTLLPPKDLDDPLYNARRRAYREQRQVVERIAQRFRESNFNFKQVMKDWVLSDFYRVDGLATVDLSPERRAELDDVGLMRLLSPEQLERKITAIFGKPSGRLQHETAMLYGAIDSKEVTERAMDPSGAMGAIARILANDVACRNTALDFSRPPAERRLFPSIDPEILPGVSRENDDKIRAAIVHLHQQVLGRYDAADSIEMDQTFQLFSSILADAKSQKYVDPREKYDCRPIPNQEFPDPHFTIRAWRAVLTYLLRQPEFLYE